MKSLRPTIPVSEWKLAVDLVLTRKLQSQPDLPAHGSECELCTHLKRGVEQALPIELSRQLKRVGVNLLHPSDIYISERKRDTVLVRCVYHAVASILSGPNQWKADEIAPVMLYREIRSTPSLSLVVLPQRDIYEPSLSFQGIHNSDLVRIDIRLEISNTWVAGQCA